jgi:hypothetical protein
MFLISLLSLCFATEYDYWGHWESPPTVVLCEAVDMNMWDVNAAAKYWESKGYPIGDIIKTKNCDNNPVRGLIKITPPGDYIDTAKHFAYTTVGKSSLSNDVIVDSIIEMSDAGIKHKEVIIHKLGHALGIKHTSDTSDIMYHEHISYHTDF